MAKHRFERVFTPEEANVLIPRLEVLVRALQVQADELRLRIREAARDQPDAAELPISDLIERYPALRQNAARMAKLAAEVEELGCFLQDIEQGLVDFPCEVDDDVVFLCWQFGEREVIAWHPIEAGFAGRRPLPGASKPYLN